MTRPLIQSLIQSLLAAAILASLTPLARADGLIVISNPPPPTVRGHFAFAPLEVTYHKVTADIKDQAATTSVDQEFYNPNSQRLEGDYIFPVPANAVINDFAMDIDGKAVHAELLPADKARDIYNTIVRQTKDPALLEYAGRSMFRVHIFPIEPNSKKHITLKYTELLKLDNGLIDYHYTLNTEKYSAKPLENVSVRVNVESAEPITTLYSPTHEIDKVLHGDKSATAGFEAKNIRPDTDFHLFIGHKAAPVGINLLSYRPDPDKDGYFVMLASPTVSKDVKVMPKDVVFVMDTSGSMAGDKIEQARKALKYCVDTLNPQDRFEVVRFSTESEPLFHGLKDASQDNRKKADEFAANIQAAGGTAIDDALQAALDDRPNAKDADGRVFLVVFMTDGQPTIGEANPDAILKHVKEKGAQIRLFSFGVGTDVNTQLLDSLASQSRGYSQYVLPNENLELSMSNFWGKVQDPIIANLKIDTGDLRTANIYPNDMPDLFKGDQLVVFGTYQKPGKGAFTLNGIVNGQPQKFSEDVTFEDKTDSSKEWIAKLWATRRVGYLLDQIRTNGESKELKDEIVALARRWGVVTPYTAMLIIEDERNRNIPVAERSMREMEFDQKAVASAAQATGGLSSTSGSQAVANAINTSDYKNVQSLQDADKAAQQATAHSQTESGAALAKAPGNMSGGSITLSPGTFSGSGNMAGGQIATGPTFNGGSMGGTGGGGGGRGGGGGGFGGGAGGGAGGAGGGFGGGAGGAAGSGRGAGGRRGGGAGGGAGGGGAPGGGGAGGPYVPPPVTPSAPSAITFNRDDLNLGTVSQNGWQTDTSKSDGQAVGYRSVSNYAQQSRVVNNRNFFLNGNQWTDSAVQNMKEAKHVKIVFGSNEYFDLLAKFPDAAQYFSLGNNVSVVLGDTIYDISEGIPTLAPGK